MTSSKVQTKTMKVTTRDLKKLNPLREASPKKDEFRSLKKKDNFSYTSPDKKILETFDNPGGITTITLTCKEFTSLCPITGQPDFGEVGIKYGPNERCLEMKSLKLYINSYRMHGAFAEETASRICVDLKKVLNPYWISIWVTFVSRGGVIIKAEVLG